MDSLSNFSFPCRIRFVCLIYISLLLGFAFTSTSISDDNDDDDDDDGGLLSFHGDYTPPSSPPPAPPPHPPSLTCENDLKGVGSLDTLCELSSNLNFTDDVYVIGMGSLYVLPGVKLSCLIEGCSIWIHMNGTFKLGLNADITAGDVTVKADNANFSDGSLINTTALAGAAPGDASGTPTGLQGGGGGHGGRGASCVVDNTKLPEDVWGGDVYAWASLNQPCSFGSKGGTTSREVDYGGKGGGRIWLLIESFIDVNGVFLADGGDGGTKGGGGSGGSIYIKSLKMTGHGQMSASGGNGFAGGGGGRVSIHVFSRRDDSEILVHGGKSYGCPSNAGAAGTFYDAVPRRLIVNNQNMSSDTDTIFYAFPYQPLWTNVYIQDHARAAVPLLWSRVQVQGQLSLSCGAVLSFGLPHFALSQFELLAEELLMSDSVIKVYGALRMGVKIFLMWNSQMLIDGDDDSLVSTSLLEASNLVVLRESSSIHSNANLGLHGQGSLNLSGPGDLIEAQRLVLSLFSGISVGPGSVLRGPLKNASSHYVTPKLYCEMQDCPRELIHPPKDCNLNTSLSFTLQICRVEDINVEGSVEGSVVHFHWVRTIFVQDSGAISASGLGCTGGVGRGRLLSNGLGSGGGHGGKGGSGYYNGSTIEGGITYGNADLPCELGSGSGNHSIAGATAGGGIIVMGSLVHPLSSLSLNGLLSADGGSFGENIKKQDDVLIPDVGPGGGSGGTILLFVHSLALAEMSKISTAGGHGGSNSGGGGGGRIHFHWSDIATGDEYLPTASANGTIQVSGGGGRGNDQVGENGTITGKACPKGLYGIFCQECPVGTFKNITGSDKALCSNCPDHELPNRAIYIPVRGGVGDLPCPYKCVSDRYHMPHCYTALEDLIYTFGGPWLFGLILVVLLILFALVLSFARVKFITVEDVPTVIPPRHNLQIDRSFPFLESLNEVLETNRTEESQTHVHRIYFMGSNTFSEPWHLPHCPPKQILEIVYEDAYNRFIDEINGLASYQWWEGTVHGIASCLVYPLAWSWLQWRRKKKIQLLREFVRSEYDHACLRSCRSRALYEGIKVAASSDLMLAYVDFFLGGDEKRDDLPADLRKRFPMILAFGGDGSYMAPFFLHNDNILTSLMSQAVPPTIWYRLVAGLNAQLRLVCNGHLRTSFNLIVNWLDTFANPTLKTLHIHVDLVALQPTASGYCQFGLVVHADEEETGQSSNEHEEDKYSCHGMKVDHSRVGEGLLLHKKLMGGVLRGKTLQTLKEKSFLYYLKSLVIHNTKPVGHQDLIGLLISILLLGDFSLVLLALLQLYSISMLDFFLFLSILPLGILFPFPAGISALFSHGPRRSAGLARIYALWNTMSLINAVVAFICGYIHYHQSSSKKHSNSQSWNFSMDESGWWMLPCGLALCKVIQVHLINFHVANLEIHDRTLYSNNPEVFWQQS
ncbi:uncharacterized protein LOC124911450 [Impatiens glandulifera]|uniref:uncharacterized protein LOC124911450 n=1 Tax=Impatiens glandulifera TaxID=253017 RepID=UPI001FB16509|nr:uncharacterized protein LOC124911450 [Impatiens glandulifera]